MKTRCAAPSVICALLTIAAGCGGDAGSGETGGAGGESTAGKGGAAGKAAGQGGATATAGASGGAVAGASGGASAGQGGSSAREDASVDAAPPPDAAPSDAAAPGRMACVLPLGDSITQADATHVSYRFPLWQKLRAAGRSFAFVGSMTTHFTGTPMFPDPMFDRRHEGHWGWRTDEVLARLAGWLANYTPGFVLLHLGSNDAFQSQSVTSTIGELETIIDRLRAKNADVVVLVAKILPTRDAGANGRIGQLNAAIPAMAERKGTARSPLVVVDQNTGFNPATDAYDGTHPNAAGEEKMAARWFAALDPLLAGTQPCQR